VVLEVAVGRRVHCEVRRLEVTERGGDLPSRDEADVLPPLSPDMKMPEVQFGIGCYVEIVSEHDPVVASGDLGVDAVPQERQDLLLGRRTPGPTVIQETGAGGLVEPARPKIVV